MAQITQLDNETQLTGVTATSEEIANVFAEWLRRYNDEPERFTEEYGEPEEYGDGCARYFVKLLGEIA